MNKRIVAIICVLVMVLSLLTVFSASAGTNYEPCSRGEHTYDLEDYLWSSSSGIDWRPKTVNSCEWASYPHVHRVPGSNARAVYKCRFCEATYITGEFWKQHDEQSEDCLEHDVGR